MKKLVKNVHGLKALVKTCADCGASFFDAPGGRRRLCKACRCKNFYRFPSEKEVR